MNERTIFRDTKGTLIETVEKLFPIPFYIGMKIILDGNVNPFEVSDLEYHYNQSDEKSELWIILKEKPPKFGKVEFAKL
jgi:hypothetical protein